MARTALILLAFLALSAAVAAAKGKWRLLAALLVSARSEANAS